MNDDRRTARIAIAAALSAALLGLGAGPAGAAQSGSTTEGTYVPFVTDFPEPVASPQSAPAAAGSGLEWGDVNVEHGVGAALAALLAAAGLAAFARRSRTAC